MPSGAFRKKKLPFWPVRDAIAYGHDLVSYLTWRRLRFANLRIPWTLRTSGKFESIHKFFYHKMNPKCRLQKVSIMSRPHGPQWILYECDLNSHCRDWYGHCSPFKFASWCNVNYLQFLYKVIAQILCDWLLPQLELGMSLSIQCLCLGLCQIGAETQRVWKYHS